MGRSGKKFPRPMIMSLGALKFPLDTKYRVLLYFVLREVALEPLGLPTPGRGKAKDMWGWGRVDDRRA